LYIFSVAWQILKSGVLLSLSPVRLRRIYI